MYSRNGRHRDAVRDGAEVFTWRRVIAFPDIRVRSPFSCKWRSRQFAARFSVPSSYHLIDTLPRRKEVFSIFGTGVIQSRVIFSLFAPKRTVVNRPFIFSLIPLWISSGKHPQCWRNGAAKCRAHAVVLLCDVEEYVACKTLNVGS